jgi:hypothetical protein
MTSSGIRAIGVSFTICVVLVAQMAPAMAAPANRLDASLRWTAFRPTKLERQGMRLYRFDRINYPRVPRPIATLMWYAVVQHGNCTMSPESQAMRQCNRWYRTATLLERHGWCMGGGEITAYDKWQRCATMPGYHTDYYRGTDGPPYSAGQIHAAELDEMRDPRDR